MVKYIDNDTTLPASDTYIAIGTKESLLEACNNSFLLNRVYSSQSAKAKKAKTSAGKLDPVLLAAVVDKLSPSNDGDDAAEMWLTVEGSPAKLVVCALRTACSRHNCPSQPHAVTALVKKHKGRGSVAVVLLTASNEAAYAPGVAVARAFPLYTRKNGAVSGVPLVAAAEQAAVVVTFTHAAAAELPLMEHTADGIQLAARLVDAPPNELYTDTMLGEAKAVVARLEGLGSTVTLESIRGQELKERGFGGIYGVGQAATHPPVMAILSYYPAGTSKTTPGVVLVGKGIVYDTGGLSIKGKEGMPGMKRDMGGAAGVLGGFQAAVASDICKKPLHCILCIAENAVGPLATRPDDVHIMYSGKSVEINNTDAEGRLVLGDGVAYAARHLQPEVLLDMATLTGAQGVATGNKIASLYCNDESLESTLVKQGQYSGDLCHGMPYCPEFFRSEFSSAVADMKNSVKDRANGQVSCAGQFIGNHLGDYVKAGRWAHIDMAYPSFTKGDERATGYGVALVLSMVKAL